MKRGATLVLVRHGETEGQSSIRYYGRTDVALSDLGRAQMRAVRDALRSRAIAAGLVFASPLSRAQESARLIAGAQPRLFTVDEFAEVDFGLFEGLTADEIRVRHPAEFERWTRDRLAPDWTYPGGESRAKFAARVECGLDRMLLTWEQAAYRDDGCALVVAHRGVLRAIMRRLAGVEPVIELASINVLRCDEVWRPEILDATDHLAEIGGPES